MGRILKGLTDGAGLIFNPTEMRLDIAKRVTQYNNEIANKLMEYKQLEASIDEIDLPFDWIVYLEQFENGVEGFIKGGLSCINDYDNKNRDEMTKFFHFVEDNSFLVEDYIKNHESMKETSRIFDQILKIL